MRDQIRLCSTYKVYQSNSKTITKKGGERVEREDREGQGGRKKRREGRTK